MQKIGSGVFSLCASLSAFKEKNASADNRSLIVNDTLVAIAPQGITSYTVPEGVKVLGNFSIWTYSESTGVKNSITHITLPESLQVIEKSAFNECATILEFDVLAVAPPVLQIYSEFLGNTITNCLTNDSKIFVPQGSVEAYKKADGWKEYAHIIFPME